MFYTTRAIIILGMHRSGTSLIARTVGSLGVYLGQDADMMPQGEDNPEGFWELTSIVQLHEKILNKLASSWDTTKPLPDEWWLSNDIEPFKNEMKNIISSYFSGKKVWGWKDPRTCLLLPLWKEVLKELHIDASFVLCVRNPLGVAASLNKRDRFSFEKSYALWSLYTLHGLYYSNGEKRTVISYEELMEKPNEVCQRLQKFLGCSDEPKIREIAVAAVNKNLRHDQFSIDDLFHEPASPADVQTLYRSMLDMTTNENKHFIEFERWVVQTLQNFKQISSILSHTPSHRMQVFWGDEQGHFSETSSKFVTIEVGSSPVRYRATIPKFAGNTLRIDPLNRIGFVQVTELKLSCGNSSYDLIDLCPIAYMDFIRVTDKQDEIIGISISNDPHIILSDLPAYDGEVVLSIEIAVSFELSKEIVKRIKALPTMAQISSTLQAMDARLLGWEKSHIEAENNLKMINSLHQQLQERESSINELAVQSEIQLELLERMSDEYKQLQEKHEEQERLLNDRANNLEDKNQEAESDVVNVLRNQLERKTEEAERYRQEISLYGNSLSWKVTKPIRQSAELLRRAKRRAKRLLKKRINQLKMIRYKSQSIHGLPTIFDYDNYALVVSHTNFLVSMGGTEKYILEQSAYLAEYNIGTIGIFPGQQYEFLADLEVTQYGVIVDGKVKGYYSIDQVVDWVVKMAKHIGSMYSHHLLYWNFGDYAKLLRKAQEESIRHTFFMHDFFALCSSYHLMYEPANVDSFQNVHQRSCIPELTQAQVGCASICTSCTHYNKLSTWREATKIIIDSAYQVVVPSDFVKDTVLSVFGDVCHKIKTHGHLTFSGQHFVHKPRHERKIRLAYLGYKMDNKGWALWEKLYQNEQLNGIYEFHHVGSAQNYDKNVVCHSYSFVTHGNMAAVNILIEQQIDVVLLWSIVPESYSYTLHEAIAAGVPVLTSPKSGNIANTLQLHPELGKVLGGEEQLMAFLHDEQSVRNFNSGERARYQLAYNHLPE
ncbi:sulfotransferase [Paenibacillus sp. YIM B09110]|uniref:sulfotransferase n=1 Tax=Paenibacillus sp. YIM B09110 TaxID=3126102 RepID=UPI00301D45B3